MEQQLRQGRHGAEPQLTWYACTIGGIIVHVQGVDADSARDTLKDRLPKISTSSIDKAEIAEDPFYRPIKRSF